MPVSVVIPFAPGATPPPGDVRGDLVHRWFLALVQARDPELSIALHRDGRHKPFTAALLGPALRLTALDADVTRHLDQLQSPPPLAFDGVVLPAAGVCRTPGEHPLARRADYHALWRRFVERAAPPPPRVRLRFVTPTAFDSPAGLFPLPALVFEGLARKWARHAPAQLALGQEPLEALTATARVVRHALRSRRVPLGRFHATGFTGECDVALGAGAPADLARLLHLLAEFAFFAGVGLKTTMGLGQVRVGAVPPSTRA